MTVLINKLGFGRFSFALLYALLCGSLSALSMSPLNMWPILFLTLGVLYILLHLSPSAKNAFAIGFLFGFGYFTLSLYWIGNALLVEGNPYRWAWPLSVVGLPFYLSFYPATAACISKRFFKLDTILGFTVFCLIFVAFEELRGHLFTGFPWNLFGYTWADTLAIAQVVAFSDVYFLTLLTIFWAAIPGFLIISKYRITYKICILVFSILSFAIVYGFGAWRLETIIPKEIDDYDILLVQPNIPQDEKWDSKKIAENFMSTVRMSANTSETFPSSTKATYIIWPETTIGSGILNTPWAMAAISDMLHTYPHPTYLITGAQRYLPENDQYFNSIIVLDNKTEILQTYNKSHLVPFGEYMPFSNIFDISPIVGFKGFERGPGTMSIEMPEGINFSPLICYEIIFPHHSINKEQKSPDFVLNVTNDAWYGISAGPYQHLVQAQFRAIENNIPVIRVANTGFTAVIDQAGRIQYRSNLFEKEVKKMKAISHSM